MPMGIYLKYYITIDMYFKIELGSHEYIFVGNLGKEEFKMLLLI